MTPLVEAAVGAGGAIIILLAGLVFNTRLVWPWPVEVAVAASGIGLRPWARALFWIPLLLVAHAAARTLWTGPWHIELTSALVGLAIAFLTGTAYQIKGPVRNIALLGSLAWAIISSIHSVLRAGL